MSDHTNPDKMDEAAIRKLDAQFEKLFKTLRLTGASKEKLPKMEQELRALKAEIFQPADNLSHPDEAVRNKARHDLDNIKNKAIRIIKLHTKGEEEVKREEAAQADAINAGKPIDKDGLTIVLDSILADFYEKNEAALKERQLARAKQRPAISPDNPLAALVEKTLADTKDYPSRILEIGRRLQDVQVLDANKDGQLTPPELKGWAPLDSEAFRAGLTKIAPESAMTPEAFSAALRQSLKALESVNVKAPVPPATGLPPVKEKTGASAAR